MTTKTEMIAILKDENPILKVGNDEEGYTELSKAEYDVQISEWADNRLAKEKQLAEIAATETAKAALLVRLNISQEEAKLLLA